jgi:hypothetical protein
MNVNPHLPEPSELIEAMEQATAKRKKYDIETAAMVYVACQSELGENSTVPSTHFARTDEGQAALAELLRNNKGSVWKALKARIEQLELAGITVEYSDQHLDRLQAAFRLAREDARRQGLKLVKVYFLPRALVTDDMLRKDPEDQCVSIEVRDGKAMAQ